MDDSLRLISAIIYPKFQLCVGSVCLFFLLNKESLVGQNRALVVTGKRLCGIVLT